jgi:hypothetical protein
MELRPLLIVSVLAALAGFCFGVSFGTSMVKAHAVKHGAAHYDAKTGSFTWNDDVKAEKHAP